MARKSRKGTDAAIQSQAQKKTFFKVGAYVRLSVEDRKRKGDSIETQQAIIRAFIDERSDLELRETYIDNGLSGQSFERPAFLRMKDDMESGEINCCVTKDLSRLGRNAIDTGYYIESYFPKHGIRYIAVTDGYDSIGGDSGGIMVSMKNMANEYYAIETGRKIRAYHQTLTREGGFSGAHPPYGYLIAANDVHRLVPDEYAGAIVRRIFEMYLSGEGVAAILEWLNTAGILTPKQYFHAKGIGTGKMGQGGLRWSAGVVKAILSNRVYRGDIERGKNKTVSCVKKRVPKTDWVVTESRHEAVVSREMFDKAQEMRKKADNSQHVRYDTPASENIFRGKIVCGHCGRSLERTRPYESIYKFRCPTRYAYTKADCVPVLIKESELKDKLLDMLRFFDIEIKQSREEAEDEQAKTELRDVQAELRKTRRLLDGLYESLISKDITDAEYREMKSAYESKFIALKERETLLRESGQRRTKMENKISKAAASLKTTRAVYELTGEAVDGLIEKIRVFEDGSIRVKFTFMEDEIPSREVAVCE